MNTIQIESKKIEAINGIFKQAVDNFNKNSVDASQVNAETRENNSYETQRKEKRASNKRRDMGIGTKHFWHSIIRSYSSDREMDIFKIIKDIEYINNNNREIGYFTTEPEFWCDGWTKTQIKNAIADRGELNEYIENSYFNTIIEALTTDTTFTDSNSIYIDDDVWILLDAIFHHGLNGFNDYDLRRLMKEINRN